MKTIFCSLLTTLAKTLQAKSSCALDFIVY